MSVKHNLIESKIAKSMLELETEMFSIKESILYCEVFPNSSFPAFDLASVSLMALTNLNPAYLP